MKKEQPQMTHDVHEHNHMAKGSAIAGNNLGNYKPLIVILLFCVLIPLVQIRQLDLQEFMYSFMGYFFIFLSLFKFFDLKGFVEEFVTYDIVTKRLRAYGYLYPFIELTLSLGYLAQYYLFMINMVTVIVMFISSIGVVKSILSGQKKMCMPWNSTECST